MKKGLNIWGKSTPWRRQAKHNAPSSTKTCKHNILNGINLPTSPKVVKKINKLIKPLFAIALLLAINIFVGFEAAVIVGLGLIIGSKLLPDFWKPKA